MRLTAAMLVTSICYLAGPLARAQSSESASDADFENFKNRVQPIFLKKRPGHGRCIVCHAGGGAPGGFGLVPLDAGATGWTEEQSRRNFEVASKMVAPGDPNSSALLLHPLAPEAGGDVFHGGGRQFESKNDPDWQILAGWVRQMKTPEYTNLKLLQPAQVGQAMQSFDVALEVECNFCHARNFAQDTNPHKALARRMIQMTKEINNNFRVSCYTCHRGQTMPKITPDPVSAMP